MPRSTLAHCWSMAMLAIALVVPARLVAQPPQNSFPTYPMNGSDGSFLPQYQTPPGVAARFAQLPQGEGQQVPWTPQPATPSELFELAETVARIGDLHIFRGDLVGEANLILAPQLEKIPEGEREAAKAQIDASRDALTRQMLQEAIQRKMMYAMFLRSIPADKLQEAKANLAERVPEQFSEQLEEMRDKLETTPKEEYRDLARQSSQLFRLAYLMQQLDITTERELDIFLRRYGSSLEKQHQAYAEDQLGRQEMFKHVGHPREVTYDDMVAYYEEHQDDFQVPTRARWEQITLQFSRFNDKYAAGEAIAKIGNELFFGAPFAAVAKRNSHGSKASEGGYHDWTSWGDFTISREINDAVFSLPPGQLSQIIVDHEGLHIVRVIERQQAHIVPFKEAQVTIRRRIEADRRSAAINEYLASLKEEVPIWRADGQLGEPEEAEQIANPPRAQGNRYSR